MNYLIIFIKSIFVFIVITVGSICIISSSGGGGGGESDNGNDSAANVPKITLEKDSGSAGSIVKVSGIDIDSCLLSTSEIRVSGQTVPAILNDKGEVSMMLPVFYDKTTKWAAPPNEPQDVEIYCNGKLLATLSGAVTVTELLPAHGTTEDIITEYRQIVADFKEIVTVLVPEPEIQQHLLTSLITAIEELLSGTGANSIPAMINGLTQDNPEMLVLLDAIFANFGADEIMVDYKEMLLKIKEDMALSLTLEPAKTIAESIVFTDISQHERITAFSADSATTSTEGIPMQLPDQILAEQMQLYSTLKPFSEQVLSEVEELMSIILGWVTIVTHDSLPWVSEVAGILKLITYTFKTLLISPFPAYIESIELTLPITTLENTEITNSLITVKAKNIPSETNLTELLDLLQSTIGMFTGGPSAETAPIRIQEQLEKTAAYFTDEVNQAFKSKPDVNYDMDVFTIIPPINFQALGSTRELYTLYPLPGGTASEVINPLTDTLEWQASAENHGKATVFLETDPGAFGDAMASSNPVVVTVGPIALVVQQSATIPEGEYETVAVKLSKPPPENKEIYVNAIRSDGDEDVYVINMGPLTFSDKNWDDYNYFVVKAKEDDDKINGLAYITVSSENMEDRTVTVSERDNDIINIVTNEDTFSIVEGASKYNGLKVKLDNEPPSPITVTISHTSGDKNIRIISEDVLHFDDSNWDTFKTITLAASKDSDFNQGIATFKISADNPNINDKFVTVQEIEIYDNALAIEASSFRTVYSQAGVNYLSDEIVGIIPLTKQCGFMGLGSVKGSAILEYNGYGTEVPYGDVICRIDIIGNAHITVEDNNFRCVEEPSLNLRLKVKTDYIYINTCPSSPPISTPNIDEYDGQVALTYHNDYQFELNQNWEEENAFGNEYLFLEILD